MRKHTPPRSHGTDQHAGLQPAIVGTSCQLTHLTQSPQACACKVVQTLMTEQKGYHFVQILTRCRPALSRGYRYVSQQKFANLSEIQPIHISTSEEANWSTRDARHIQQHLEVLSLLWKPVSDCKADWSLKSPHTRSKGGLRRY